MRSECVDVLCDFLEAAVHQILFSRELYPKEMFERRRMFQLPVQMSRHPLLNKYILDCVQSIRPMLTAESIDQVAVDILRSDATRVPLERFVIQVQPLAAASANAGADQAAGTAQLQTALRPVLLRLSLASGMLSPLPTPHECDWRFLVFTNSFSRQANTLIPAEMPEMPGSRMTPLKSCRLSQHVVQVYAEESAAKLADASAAPGM